MTLLQQWTQYAYYARQVVELLKDQYDLNGWLVDEIHFHLKDGATPEEAAQRILEKDNKKEA